MLRAVGFHDDDFDRLVVGVASLFSDITPCTSHLDRLARKGCEGVRAAGGVPQIFGAPTASDGIMMGHRGMRYSLVSREVIADSIEVVAGGMNHDGVLAFGGCDKNMPGCLMAMARLNVPSVFVYGGSILPGIGPEGQDVDIVSIFEAVGQFQADKIDAKRLHKIECESCPGQLAHSTLCSIAASIAFAWNCPTASKMDTMSTSSPCGPTPGRMLPPYTNTLGMLSRAIAMMQPGMFLSQPPMATTPSKPSQPTTVSIESAMTSRDTSEYFIPSVPIEMPS